MTSTEQSRTTQPTHRIAAEDGRILAVDVTGPAEGPAVLLLHAAPGSRCFDPDPATTSAAGIRLVTFDRAGYGASSPLGADTRPTVAGHAADAATVLDHLGLGPVAVVGWSAGGRIAAALAARRPDLVSSVAIVATPAPDDQVSWVPDHLKAMCVELRRDPATALAGLTEALAGMDQAVADPTVAVAQVAGGPADDAVLAARPGLAEAIATSVQVGFAPGLAGVAADIAADQLFPWGFDPGAVAAPTTCWYGADDAVVSVAHGAWYAEHIPGATCTEVPDVGHLVVTTAWPDILDAASAAR